MSKTILITGSTDGIGLETASMLAEQGHHVLLHGRNAAKLEATRQALSERYPEAAIDAYQADLSRFAEVQALADSIKQQHSHLDVLINNAGVYNTPNTVADKGLDVRFVVNTLAPYLLMQKLADLLGPQARVVNLSSAAQASVSIAALNGEQTLSDGQAYAQSKLALTIWSRVIGLKNQQDQRGPLVVAVNPASMLGSKMVKDAFGVAGGDLRVGADILCRAALSEEFADASGKYFDNDSRRFASPHPDALDPDKSAAVMAAIEQLTSGL
ncbi:SDR family NAD(P)-dependent oxidoreductase [Aliagarivorans marinus]|uniref:SDR family NAD(P)-dependent oxidoreductase n=1 Tax=Aliagarivorans marinus TaxID=561965 RepID=UPI00040F6E27|nr:SDR family NAD(P)-dependent oxidoreductase [Aliagarivorans marinus]